MPESAPEHRLPLMACGHRADLDTAEGAFCSRCIGVDPGAVLVEAPIRELPIHRTEAGYPSCSTCDGGGCPDCTDPA